MRKSSFPFRNYQTQSPLLFFFVCRRLRRLFYFNSDKLDYCKHFCYFKIHTRLNLWKYVVPQRKLSSGYRTRKAQFSFHFQRRALPRNVPATVQLQSFHMLASIMLKILQVRLQQYMNWELPDVQAGFRKGRGTRDQIANIWWVMEKAREDWKNIYFCLIVISYCS